MQLTPVSCEPPQRSPRSAIEWLRLTLLLIVCGFFALPLDMGVARAFREGLCPGFLDDVLQRTETFAHGIGITAIFIILFLADRGRRWAFPRAVLAVVCAGLTANVLKLLISRYRPHSTDLNLDVAETFTGLLPLFSVGSGERGTPSSHTAAAVAFAIALCWLYPRGRSAFLSLATLAAAQRIVGGAHFLSDVFWGAAVGYFIGRGFIAGWLTSGWFNRAEAARYRGGLLLGVEADLPPPPVANENRPAA